MNIQPDTTSGKPEGQLNAALLPSALPASETGARKGVKVQKTSTQSRNTQLPEGVRQPIRKKLASDYTASKPAFNERAQKHRIKAQLQSPEPFTEEALMRRLENHSLLSPTAKPHGLMLALRQPVDLQNSSSYSAKYIGQHVSLPISNPSESKNDYDFFVSLMTPLIGGSKIKEIESHYIFQFETCFQMLRAWQQEQAQKGTLLTVGHFLHLMMVVQETYQKNGYEYASVLDQAIRSALVALMQSVGEFAPPFAPLKPLAAEEPPITEEPLATKTLSSSPSTNQSVPQRDSTSKHVSFRDTLFELDKQQLKKLPAFSDYNVRSRLRKHFPNSGDSDLTTQMTGAMLLAMKQPMKAYRSSGHHFGLKVMMSAAAPFSESGQEKDCLGFEPVKAILSAYIPASVVEDIESKAFFKNEFIANLFLEWNRSLNSTGASFTAGHVFHVLFNLHDYLEATDHPKASIVLDTIHQTMGILLNEVDEYLDEIEKNRENLACTQMTLSGSQPAPPGIKTTEVKQGHVLRYAPLSEAAPVTPKPNYELRYLATAPKAGSFPSTQKSEPDDEIVKSKPHLADHPESIQPSQQGFSYCEPFTPALKTTPVFSDPVLEAQKLQAQRYKDDMVRSGQQSLASPTLEVTQPPAECTPQAAPPQAEQQVDDEGLPVFFGSIPELLITLKIDPIECREDRSNTLSLASSLQQILWLNDDSGALANLSYESDGYFYTLGTNYQPIMLNAALINHLFNQISSPGTGEATRQKLTAFCNTLITRNPKATNADIQQLKFALDLYSDNPSLAEDLLEGTKLNYSLEHECPIWATFLLHELIKMPVVILDNCNQMILRVSENGELQVIPLDTENGLTQSQIKELETLLSEPSAIKLFRSSRDEGTNSVFQALS